MSACDHVWLWSLLFVSLAERTSQTFCGWLNNSGGSCSSAGREAAAVARGSRHQGTGLAGRSSGRDRSRSLARNEQCCGVAS